MNKFLLAPTKLQPKLKKADPNVQKYIIKLEADVIRLDAKNSDLEVDNKRFNIRVKSLEAELSKYEPPSREELERLAGAALASIDKLKKSAAKTE